MSMKRNSSRKWPVFSALLCFATFASAQSTPTTTQMTQKPSQDTDHAGDQQGRDIDRGELARVDRFLDSHPEIAQQLRQNPSLVNDPQFVKDHASLKTYLQQHPEMRDALKDNPNAFMRSENRYDRSEDRRGAERREIASFDQYLDRHREISEQLHKNPNLINDPQFVKDHPPLMSYMKEHPDVTQALQENPDAFMHAEDRYERNDDSFNRNGDRREVASFHQFLDQHREVGEQLQKNPSLAGNQQFLKDHPALQSYLQDHPEVRQQLRQNPDAFMQQESRYDRHDDDIATRNDYDRDRNNHDRDRDTGYDRDHDAQRHFGEFLGSHNSIARDLDKDPSLVKRQEYLQDHPELQQYLDSNPDVRERLMADPNRFIKSTPQLNIDGQGVKNSTTAPPATTSPTSTPKPNKQ
jgi:hypothetical protein